MRSPDGTAFDIHGPLDAPAVVLIHGLGLTRAVWQLTRPALVARYRVVTYDLLGHGQTPTVPVPTLAHLTRQLADLLEYLHLPSATVVGFSLGGETSLARLAECMAQVRQTSLNPVVRIIAGGAIFALHPEYAAQISADAIITDGSAAPELAEKLVSRAALLN